MEGEERHVYRCVSVGFQIPKTHVNGMGEGLHGVLDPVELGMSRAASMGHRQNGPGLFENGIQIWEAGFGQMLDTTAHLRSMALLIVELGDVRTQLIEPVGQVLIATIDHIDRTKYRSSLRCQHGQKNHHGRA